MNRKAGLYAVIGGCIGAVLTMAVCSVLPLGAQSQSGNFGAITCTELRLVDVAGGTQALVYYNDEGECIAVYGKDRSSMVTIRIDEKGGFINRISNRDSSGTAGIGINEQGTGILLC